MSSVNHHSAKKSKRGYVTELQRLAEFGKVSASLIHDLSTPLTAAALTLDEANVSQPSLLIRNAKKQLKQIEFYVTAAKNQLKGESDLRVFSLPKTIRQVMLLLDGRAKTLNVRVIASSHETVHIYGDPIKFQRLLANLIVNAIEAYEGFDTIDRLVRISWRRINVNEVSIIISDKGKGISRSNQRKIFEPFYTTKSGTGKGLGLGLSSVKHYIERDFNGKIIVSSWPKTGTKFILTIPAKTN